MKFISNHIFSIKKILLIFLIFSVISCDVNRLPETAISDETFWRSETDLKAACNYLYVFLPGFNNEDTWSDDAFGLAASNVSDGTRLAPATDATNYNNFYNLIRASNNIIEKASRATPTTTQLVIDRYVAEARFFRAWGYYELLRRYGSVPLITKTLTINSAELSAPASSRDAIADLIYQDLDFAALKLPTHTTLGTADYGRVSNTSAFAFKARVALFEGTRAKFHSYGNPAKHLTIAFNAAKAVIDSKQHDLFGDYFNLFQYEGEGRQNRENIIVKQYGISTTDRVVTHGYYRVNLEGGQKNPTKSLVDSYLMKDGLPISKSPLYKTPTTTVEVFANRDERLLNTVFKKGDAYTGATPLYNVAVLGSQKTGFTFRKYANVNDWINISTIDRSLLRYDEVLLTYAEAKFELDGAITDAELELTINRLRTRAKVAKLTNAFVTANGLSMRDEIRRERRVELAQEGGRYWDLLRWKIAEVELPKPILGNTFFKAEFGTSVSANTTPEGFILLQAASFRRFDPVRDYLWPLPINEISLNPALKQNSGW
jgi:starch-binding outer membrane protein, SusD/RagB family